nr:immunoglobulin light chain junction region [Macaca mulatta]
CQQHDCSPRTF